MSKLPSRKPNIPGMIFEKIHNGGNAGFAFAYSSPLDISTSRGPLPLSGIRRHNDYACPFAEKNFSGRSIEKFMYEPAA